MVYFGFTETVGRLCLPLAADRGMIRHSTLMAVSFAAMAASMILLERGATLWTLTVGASLFAAFFGAAVTVEGVVIANYLGVDCMSFVFGFTGAISVPFFFANPFVLGLRAPQFAQYPQFQFYLKNSCKAYPSSLKLRTWGRLDITRNQQ
ncbi:hypothetical protein HPB49_026424 [Dermacentor silvarum]|nr:hypothetical protein HPB49_026424 [Dermacentor silvarum]